MPIFVICILPGLCVLDKKGTFDDLMEAIVSVVVDGKYYNEQMKIALLDKMDRKVIYPVFKGKQELNDLEKNYLKWFCLGLLPHQIAAKIGKRPSYISGIKSAMKKKIGAKSDVDIMNYAFFNDIHNPKE